jgi:hypothetical protein
MLARKSHKVLLLNEYVTGIPIYTTHVLPKSGQVYYNKMILL